MELAWVFYPLLGVVAGLLAGLLGVGGGLVIVPALAWWFSAAGFPPGELMQFAVASSLATIVVTSISSLLAHHRRGAVCWGLMPTMGAGIVAGAFAGGWGAGQVSSGGLQSVFGLFELAVAVQMWAGFQARAGGVRGGPGGYLAAGGLIGGVSALLGIGGGTLSVPFLRWRGVDMRQAVGTAAAAGLPIALAGTAGFLSLAVQAPVPLATGYLYWPAILGIGVASVIAAPVGARWAHRLPRALLQRVFAVVLAGVGFKMLVL